MKDKTIFFLRILLSIHKTFTDSSRAKTFILKMILNFSMIGFMSHAHATYRLADAEVLDKNGVPCFTIGKKEEQYSTYPITLGAAVVSDAKAKKFTIVWEFSLLPQGRTMRLSSNIFIPYGTPPPGAASGEKAMALQVGKIYSVFLNAKPDDRTDPTHGYTREFCLLQRPNGQVKVHQIDYSDEEWQCHQK